MSSNEENGWRLVRERAALAALSGLLQDEGYYVAGRINFEEVAADALKAANALVEALKSSVRK